MKRRIQVVGGLVFMLAGSALGAGFQLYTEGSAEALGQAAAISGRDDLTSLAWYNPAALAGSDKAAVMAGTTFVQIQTDFNSTSNSAFDASMSDDWRIIPNFYYVQPISSNLTAMLSVNAPYGLITEWPRNWAGNLAATYSEFYAIYTTPSIAYRVNDRLAVAAGVNVVYAEARLRASRDFSVLGGPDFGLRTVDGDDMGYGYTASAHGKLGNDWAVGVRYQSRVKVDLDGTVDFQSNPVPPGKTRFNGSAEVELPSSVNAGVTKSFDERLKLGLDAVWTEWSTYDALVYRFGAGYPATPVTPNPEANSKRWKDVWSIRAGGEYGLTDEWLLRAGYVWDQSPENDRTRSPELPDSDRQMVTTGLGWSRENLNVDLAYSYLWANDSRTGSEVVAKVPTLKGTYTTVTHILGISVGYTF